MKTQRHTIPYQYHSQLITSCPISLGTYIIIHFHFTRSFNHNLLVHFTQQNLGGISELDFFQAGCPPFCSINNVNALEQFTL